MENAKHIGGLWALAVALGVGMAVANPPAVALAAPGDSGKGRDSGSSSSNISSSSDTSSTQSSSSPNSDSSNRHRNPLTQPGATGSSDSAQTSATAGSSADTSGPTTRQRTGPSSRPGLGNLSVKTSPNLTASNAAAAGPTAPDSSRLDFIRVAADGVPAFAATTPSAVATPTAATVVAPQMTSNAAAAALTPSPASTRMAPPADPVSSLVSTLINVILSPINAILSPFAKSAPTAPAQEPALFTMLAFARREFDQTLSTPSTAVNPLAGQVTNTLVADPDFISSTRDFFGLFSITSAADPDDNDFVAVVTRTPFFTDVLTSGTDPEDSLGLGAAGIGVAGQTVNTFISPFFNFSIAIPVTDPFAKLFTALIQAGLV